MTDPYNQSPVNPLPPAVLALFLAIAGVELTMWAGAQGLVGGPGAIGWRATALQQYGFNAQLPGWMLENRVAPPEHLIRFIAYPFVHGTFTHAIFAGVLLLALGKFVAEVVGQFRVLVLFFLSSLGGALLFSAIGYGQPWLFGAFPGVYGLIGGFTYVLWLRLGAVGAQQYRAFTMIGVLLGLQLVFGLVFGGSNTWIAEVGGFVSGFAASVVIFPGGWARLRQKLQQRQ